MNEVLSEIKKSAFYWLLPPGIADICKELRATNPLYRALSRPNSRFNGIHQGERCFVLCSGPSIKKQNLMLLKDEIVFAVSSSYYHKDYLAIQPKYHCVPRVKTNKYLHLEDIIAWLKEMDSRIGLAELFLDASQGPLVKQYNLFTARRVNYLYTGFIRNESDKDIIDISGRVPGITTSPILCMIIAMYMGFKEIYLLGVDNDYWRIGEYKYFYEPTIFKGKDESMHPDGRPRDPLYEQFLGFGKLLKQYRMMHNIARANGVEIYNATEGGGLEEYERIKFESLFQK
jgi:hypothetical protein